MSAMGAPQTWPLPRGEEPVPPGCFAGSFEEDDAPEENDTAEAALYTSFNGMNSGALDYGPADTASWKTSSFNSFQPPGFEGKGGGAVNPYMGAMDMMGMPGMGMGMGMG